MWKGLSNLTPEEAQHQEGLALLVVSRPWAMSLLGQPMTVESTIELAYTADQIDASKFEIPAGFHETPFKESKFKAPPRPRSAPGKKKK